MEQCLITHTQICTIFSFTQTKCHEPLLPDVVVFLQAARLLHPFVFHVFYLQATPVLLSSYGVRTARQRTSVETRLLSPLRSHWDCRTCLRLTAGVVTLSALHKLKEAKRYTALILWLHHKGHAPQHAYSKRNVNISWRQIHM
jgi:hypothetical protein